MPYGARVVCAMLGGLLLGLGVGMVVDAFVSEAFDLDAMSGLAMGLGIGLLATAFVRRD